jgi:hypothetical protein
MKATFQLNQGVSLEHFNFLYRIEIPLDLRRIDIQAAGTIRTTIGLAEIMDRGYRRQVYSLGSDQLAR